MQCLLASLAVSLSLAIAADRVTLTGKVTDGQGKPLEDATVMIYHAGVKQGYSTFCPSCYADCGKRAVTDRDGSFTIPKLDPDLVFELMVVRDGYQPRFVDKTDPSRGPAETAALAPRTAVDDPGRVVRGRVIDSDHRPVRAAVVLPQGVATDTEAGPASLYGAIDGLDPVAVTNPKGEFEVAYSKKASSMLLQVEARGMAAKVIVVPTGAERRTISVSDGVVIRGRLMNEGKPVAGAEIGLYPRSRGAITGPNLKIAGDFYSEIRIGTQEDGSFVITNVPAPVEWYIYAKMESIRGLGAAQPLECATRRDKEEVEIGDIQIQPGYRLRGKVTLSDGTAMGRGMRVNIGSTRAFDTQTAMLGRDGSFEFTGLANGEYEIFTSVRGYELPGGKYTIAKKIDRDNDDFALVLEPAPRH